MCSTKPHLNSLQVASQFVRVDELLPEDDGHGAVGVAGGAESVVRDAQVLRSGVRSQAAVDVHPTLVADAFSCNMKNIHN